jgi:late competence protein required for DNA uptake (superfamily II DNA/RNA helicase)
MSKNIQEYVVGKVLENIELKDKEIEKLKEKNIKLKEVLSRYDIIKCSFCTFYTKDCYECSQCGCFYCIDCNVGCDLCMDCF